MSAGAPLSARAPEFSQGVRQSDLNPAQLGLRERGPKIILEGKAAAQIFVGAQPLLLPRDPRT